jgi:monovalent cation:proton antiporter-2 (CPA2) family protein
MTETHYLKDILVLLAAAVVIVPLAHRCGLGSVIGYLVAGALLGPWGLGIIEQVSEIRQFAEFGVVFLLFVIGIEMKPARLWVMRRLVFGLGLSQLLVTGAALTGIALALELPLKTSIVVGFGLALSSTAFGLQLLIEKGELTSVTGRSSFAILLLQDLAVVPLLALVSLLSGGGALVASAGTAILEAVLVIGGMVLAGRYLLNPVLDRIAAIRNAEIFTATAVLLVLGVAWLMETAGLSMALGAFLAGLMLAESHYRHQIEADIQPFRGILLGLFFMSVGMSIDLGMLVDRPWVILGLVAGLMALKALIAWGLCRLSGLNNANATRVGLLLSQSGEFGFVLFSFAAASGVLAGPLFQTLLLVIGLSMVTTPFVVALGDAWVRQRRNKEPAAEPMPDGVREAQSDIIIAGFGRVGQRVGAILTAAEIPFVALDHDHAKVEQGRLKGFPVFYGDASRFDVLQAAGAEHSRMIIVTLDEPQQTERLVQTIRQHYPSLPIHVRARDRAHCEGLRARGATTTISETLEASLRLGEYALSDSGVPKEKSQQLIDEFRTSYQARVKGAALVGSKRT